MEEDISGFWYGFGSSIEGWAVQPKPHNEDPNGCHALCNASKDHILPCVSYRWLETGRSKGEVGDLPRVLRVTVFLLVSLIMMRARAVECYHLHRGIPCLQKLPPRVDVNLRLNLNTDEIGY